MKHKIRVENITGFFDLPLARLKKMVDWILTSNNQLHPWNITVIFVDDDFILDQNIRFFKKSTPTDVISFNLSDSDTDLEGEIYISIDMAKQNADYYNVTFENELLRLVAHGTYHLLNQNDKSSDEKHIMADLENKALEYIYSTF